MRYLPGLHCFQIPLAIEETWALIGGFQQLRLIRVSSSVQGLRAGKYAAEQREASCCGCWCRLRGGDSRRERMYVYVCVCVCDEG